LLVLPNSFHCPFLALSVLDQEYFRASSIAQVLENFILVVNHKLIINSYYYFSSYSRDFQQLFHKGITRFYQLEMMRNSEGPGRTDASERELSRGLLVKLVFLSSKLLVNIDFSRCLYAMFVSKLAMFFHTMRKLPKVVNL
jgi:hypothetical protein